MSSPKLAYKTFSENAPILKDGLLDDVVKNSIGFLRNKRKLKNFGTKVKRGILLEGPPGNGKTMVCRYLKNLCKLYDISTKNVSAGEIETSFHNGDLEQLFGSHGHFSKIIFLDDVDISYLNRKAGDRKMACSILSAMDGINDQFNVVRIFTTNEQTENLDEAFLRPGRIDKKITFEKPDRTLREKFIKSWPTEIPIDTNIQQILDATENCSFSDLEFLRTTYVMNYMETQEWNIYFAINALKNRETKKEKTVGFTVKK